MADPRFITRIAIRNYKSIAECDVRLPGLAFLVGPNGAGKSNFLDALRFVADSLNESLDHAVRRRGGIHEVLHRVNDNPLRRRTPGEGAFGRRAGPIAIRLDLRLDGSTLAHYAVEITASDSALGEYWVSREECVVGEGADAHSFSVVDGEVRASAAVAPAATRDRLYLVSASGLPEFRAIYEALAHMAFYNLVPGCMREPQPPNGSVLLHRDGGNVAAVVHRLLKSQPAIFHRIEEYLGVIVPGLSKVTVRSYGAREALLFSQKRPGALLRLPADSMSDGTLRALGILVALFQSRSAGHERVPLVGIEEPEAALHPAAIAAILDSLREASAKTQVLVTSHSPDLLDTHDVAAESILAVSAEKGVTQIAPLSDIGRDVLRDRLYTPGELLRIGQLQPGSAAIAEPEASQTGLFDFPDQP